MDTPHDRPTRERGGPHSSRERALGHSSTRYEKFPSGDCVYWTPWKHWVSGSRFYSPYEIVMSQPVLATIREHIAADLDREVLGLLGGALLVCPETLRRWIKVEEAFEPVPPAPVGVNGENLEQALLPLIAEARGGGWSPIGWYHVCGRKSFTLSETEAEIHARHFSLPWHVILLVLADLGRPAGGIFVRSESGRLSRSEYRPFYELLGEEAHLPKGRVRSFVGWQNYMTDAAVVRAFSEADDVNGWNVEYPDRPPARSRRVRKAGRIAVAASLGALLASAWLLRDRIPFVPSDGLPPMVEFASPAESESVIEPPAAGPSETPPTGPGGTTARGSEETSERGEVTPARFDALASAYWQAVRDYRRDLAGCSRLADAYQAVNEAFKELSGSGGSGNGLREVVDRLNRSMENGSETAGSPTATDLDTRMRRIRDEYLRSGCELP